MKSISRSNLTVYVMAIVFLLAMAVKARRFGGAPLSFSRVDSISEDRLLFSARGGDATLADSDEETDAVSEDEEEEEETNEAASTLASSATKATDTSRKTRTAKAKTALSEELLQKKSNVSKKKKKSRGLRLPYILGACMNPFSVLAMTKAYFASLVNLDYFQKNESQGLRSALEEKAKKGGGARGRRKMKPGQAKTLSDLPQLST